MNEFFTWERLATYAGAALATGILTQFLKGAFKKLPTQILAYILALIILLLAQVFTGTLTASSAVLALVNAVLVATATSGTVDLAKRLKGGK